MAPKEQPRQHSHKSWIRGDASISSIVTGVRSKRVWTRPDANEATGAAPVRQPTATPAGATARKLQPQGLANISRPDCSSQAQRPLPHAGSGALANRWLRQGGPGNSAPLDAPAATAAASKGSTVHQYVRRKRNQLTPNASHQQPGAAGPADAQLQHAPARPAGASGSTPAGNLRPPRPQQFAHSSQGSKHPRAVLQQQMAERAAALAGHTRNLPRRPESADHAPKPQSQHQQQSAPMPALKPPHGAKVSKRWVRPELAAAGSTRIALGTPGSAAPQGMQRQGFASPAASAAASRTPGSAYRPLLPAWALSGFRARGSSRLASTPGTPRRQNASLRARRDARTWVRQDGQNSHSSQGGAHLPAQAASSASQAAPHSKGYTWRREPDAAGVTAESRPAAAPQTFSRQLAAHASPLRQGRQLGGGSSTRPGGKPAAKRPAKLQRIGEHMYRVGGGKGGGRTLQRQAHTPAPTATTPADVAQQMSVRKALRYAKRGRHRRVLIRRLSGAPSTPASPRSSDAMRHRLRLGVGSRSTVIKKRKGVSRLGRTPRAKIAKLLAQIYCTDFCRTGKCKERQRCKYVHDPAKVAVCPKWLQGHCEDADCKLQHWHRPELMPVCTFFLQGACSKTDCPYLHVNLDPDARVCQAFLRGWCPDGAACRQKHLTPDMVRRLRREHTLRPGAQAAGTLQRRKRKRYFEADAADVAEAVAGASAADESEAAVEAAAAAVGDDASYHTESDDSDSEYEDDGLAWGDFMEV